MRGLPILIGLLCLIIILRLVLRGVGRAALQRVVKEIHLAPITGHEFSDPELAERYRSAFAACGFADAGTYRVGGIEGLAVQFFFLSEPRMYGVIYDHAQRGMRWINLVMLFADGTSATLTDSPNRGLAQRPGHEIHHWPGESVETMFQAAQKYAAQKAPRPYGAAELPGLFERAYLDGMTWRMQHGISSQEVINVAKTRKS